MKSLTAWVLAGTLAILAVPMAAQAQEWREHRFHRGDGYGWRYRDIGRDRHDIGGDWRDVAHDRHELREDIENRNWAAARAERADIYRDLRDIHRDRRDLHRDYEGFRGPNFGYAPYRAPRNYGYGPARTYGYIPGTYNGVVPQAYYPGQGLLGLNNFHP
jgi:hypothetical protein